MPYPYEKANTYDSSTGKDNVEQKNTPAYFTAAVGATQIKTGPGYLDLVSGLPGTGAVNFYDLAAGTTASLANQVASFPAGSLTQAATGVTAVNTLQVHGVLNNGLFINIVSTATTFNGTVSFT